MYTYWFTLNPAKSEFKTASYAVLCTCVYRGKIYEACRYTHSTTYVSLLSTQWWTLPSHIDTPCRGLVVSPNPTVPLALLYTPWSLWEIIGSICCWLCAVFLAMTCWLTYPEFNPLCYAWVCKYASLSTGECGGTSLRLRPLRGASSKRARTATVVPRNCASVAVFQPHVHDWEMHVGMEYHCIITHVQYQRL